MKNWLTIALGALVISMGGLAFADNHEACPMDKGACCCCKDHKCCSK